MANTTKTETTKTAKKPSGLYPKLLELQKSVRGLGKDASGGSYQYVSGSKLLFHVRPKMDELGLLLKQEIIDTSCHREDYATRNGQKAEMFTQVRMRFTWIDTETGERDENEFTANGMNGWDKGLGSALTYGERYFLLKYFHIATDEDDVDAIRRDEPEAPAADINIAVKEASEAKSLAEVDAVWNRWAFAFGENTEFVDAITNNPHNK